MCGCPFIKDVGSFWASRDPESCRTDDWGSMRLSGKSSGIWHWLGYYGLLLLSFALLAAASLAARLAIESTEQKARESRVVVLESRLRTTQQAFRLWLEARLADSRALGTDAELLDAARDLFANERLASPRERYGAESYFDAVVRGRFKEGAYLNWGFVDSSGRGQLASDIASLSEVGELLRHRPQILESVRAGHSRFLPLGNHATGEQESSLVPQVGSPTLYLVVPIWGDDEVVSSALFLELALPTSWLWELSAVSRLERLLVFNGTARLLCPSLREEANPGNLSCFTVDSSRGKMVSAINQRRSVVDADGYTNERGERCLGAWVWDDETGLGLGLELDERAALVDSVGFVEYIGVGWLVVALALCWTVVGAWIGRARVRGVESQARTVLERRVAERTRELTQQTESLTRQLDEQRLNEVKLRNAQRNLEESTERFARLSQTDALTGLANRRRFDEFIEREWRLGMRHGTSVSLILVDIDYFKLFNDAYGHKAGDDCLREIADVMMSAGRRAEDLAARLGGDKFALLLCDADADGIRAAAQHIRDAIESLAIDHEMTMVQDADTVTVSIGYASLLPDENGGSSLLVYHADEALFCAKQDGRNCIRSYEDCLVATKSSSHLRSMSPSMRARDPLGHRGRPQG